jgi:hypothetical protein
MKKYYHLHNPKGSQLLSKNICLPSSRTLPNMLNKIPCRPGINKQILNSLKTRVQDLKENEKFCAVVFDEISIAPLLQYNSKEDYIKGVEDFRNPRTSRINYAVFFYKRNLSAVQTTLFFLLQSWAY